MMVFTDVQVTLTNSQIVRNFLLAVTENIGARYTEATGAKIRGLYFEGPYFTEKYKGAQNPSYMSPRMDNFVLGKGLK